MKTKEIIKKLVFSVRIVDVLEMLLLTLPTGVLAYYLYSNGFFTEGSIIASLGFGGSQFVLKKILNNTLKKRIEDELTNFDYKSPKITGEFKNQAKTIDLTSKITNTVFDEIIYKKIQEVIRADVSGFPQLNLNNWKLDPFKRKEVFNKKVISR